VHTRKWYLVQKVVYGHPTPCVRQAGKQIVGLDKWRNESSALSKLRHLGEAASHHSTKPTP